MCHTYICHIQNETLYFTVLLWKLLMKQFSVWKYTLEASEWDYFELLQWAVKDDIFNACFFGNCGKSCLQTKKMKQCFPITLKAAQRTAGNDYKQPNEKIIG